MEAYGMIRFHDKNTGEVYKEIKYKVDSLATVFRKLYYNEDSHTFTIIGSAYYLDKHGVKLGCKRGYLLITHWDYDLNLLKDTVIGLNNYYGYNSYLWYIEGNKTQNGDLLIMGIATNLIDFRYHREVLFARLDKTGNILKWKWIRKLPHETFKSSIIENREQNGYLVFAHNMYKLDKDFEIIDKFATWDTGYIRTYNNTSKIFSKYKYLVNVLFKNNHNKGLALFDNNFNISKRINISRAYSNDDIVDDYPIARRNFDYIDTSTIYTGAQDIWYRNHTFTKVNFELEPYWIKYMSMNDALGQLVWTMKATSDRGVSW